MKSSEKVVAVWGTIVVVTICLIALKLASVI